MPRLHRPRRFPLWGGVEEMKSFDSWFNEFSIPQPKQWTEGALELFEHNHINPSEYTVGMELTYPCIGCEEERIVDYDPNEFTPDMAYFSCSPMCVP